MVAPFLSSSEAFLLDIVVSTSQQVHQEFQVLPEVGIVWKVIQWPILNTRNNLLPCNGVLRFSTLWNQHEFETGKI